MDINKNDIIRLHNKFIKDSGDNIKKNYKSNKFKTASIPDRGDVIKISSVAQNTGVNKMNGVNDDVFKVNGVRKAKRDDRYKTSDVKIVNKAERSDEVKVMEDPKHAKTNQRIPVIKTTTKNQTKLYNVTFTEPKQTKALRITIPDVTRKKTRIPKLDTRHLKSSKSSKYKSNRGPSPVLAKKASPETEVAKWTPSNKHTKSYYDAWLNFDAISRNFKSKMEKEKLLKYQRELERRESPELIYENFADERFTGRIKVNHR